MKKHNDAVDLNGKIFSGLFILVMLSLGVRPLWAAPKDSPWGGDYFPNVVLTDQDGKKHRFYDDLIKDKVVAINFIYTQCGDSCPLETANLKRVYNQLGDRVGKDIFFYSISIDGKRDNVKSLKTYSERFKTGPGWLFLTGKQKDTILIRKKLGMYDSEGEKKLSDHKTSFVVGNESTGQWIKKTPYDDPSVLAYTLSYSLPKQKILPAGMQVDHAKSTEIPNYSKVGELFHSRCASCHSLGNEDGIGPGLAGVTQRRDKTWLARWLKEPKKMLTEKDPIATEMFNRYNKILMPDIKLSDSDVNGLIDFLQSQNKAAK
jgi:protein SCO1